VGTWGTAVVDRQGRGDLQDMLEDFKRQQRCPESQAVRIRVHPRPVISTAAEKVQLLASVPAFQRSSVPDFKTDTAVAPPRHPPRHTPTCAPSPLNLRGLWTQESLGKTQFLHCCTTASFYSSNRNAQCPTPERKRIVGIVGFAGTLGSGLLDSQRVGSPLRYNAILVITARLKFTSHNPAALDVNHRRLPLLRKVLWLLRCLRGLRGLPG